MRLDMTTMETLASAPLAYVLAGVYFEEDLNLPARIPEAQAQLRAQFPRYQRLQLQQVQITDGPAVIADQVKAPQVSLHSFSNAAKTKGVVLTTGSLVYHVTEYTKPTDFLAGAAAALQALQSILQSVFVIRVALRYVDAITIDDDETAFQYVREGFAGAKVNELKERETRRVQIISHHVLEEGELMVRFATGLKGAFMPPDLFPGYLAPAQAVQRAQARPQQPVQTAILDFDRFVQGAEPFDAAKIAGQLAQQQRDIYAAFHSVVTEYAIAKWKKQPG